MPVLLTAGTAVLLMGGTPMLLTAGTAVLLMGGTPMLLKHPDSLDTVAERGETEDP